MARIVLILFLFSICISCSEDETSDCSVSATVRDLTGLDGCGFVFELEDGSRLEPIIYYYIQHEPSDPLSNFQFVDGKKVMIDYEVTDRGSVCMVGQVVRITCLTEVGIPEPGN